MCVAVASLCRAMSCKNSTSAVHTNRNNRSTRQQQKRNGACVLFFTLDLVETSEKSSHQPNYEPNENKANVRATIKRMRNKCAPLPNTIKNWKWFWRNWGVCCFHLRVRFRSFFICGGSAQLPVGQPVNRFSIVFLGHCSFIIRCIFLGQSRSDELGQHCCSFSNSIRDAQGHVENSLHWILWRFLVFQQRDPEITVRRSWQF